MLSEILFPHEKIRPIQDKVIEKVKHALETKTNLILNAPTGLGKTDSTLPLALSYALKNNLIVFFLTSKHTQHKIAINSLKKIKQKYNVNFTAIDLIGKKWMCLQDNTDKMQSSQFVDYCHNLREQDLCEFYLNFKKKNKITGLTKLAAEEINKNLPLDVEDLIKIAKKYKLCPYEVSLFAAKKARVIIADFYHIFSPSIRKSIFDRIDNNLNNSIIIVDEAHNLPKRTTELFTNQLTTFILNRSLKEAKFLKDDEAINIVNNLKDILFKFSESTKDPELLIKKSDFIQEVNNISYYDDIINKFKILSETILLDKKKKISYLDSIASFLESWLGPDYGFARILKKEKGYISLKYKCLDPSLATKQVIDNSYISILMSGTLSPTNMYKDLLGINKVIEAEFQSPFPIENKLSIIIPKTSTKFTLRNDVMFKDIANICTSLINNIPGNSFIFFPSYELRDKINFYFQKDCKKTIFFEQQGANKALRQELLEKFKSYKDVGAVLLATNAGSFSEGIDLPGDLLKAVIIVGLPLSQPDLETKELIRFYDEKFQNGWNYGYIYPAIIKAVQAAGRCIRSETDRGLIIFLDSRYIQQNYLRCFPKDWKIEILKEPEQKIKEFFNK